MINEDRTKLDVIDGKPVVDRFMLPHWKVSDDVLHKYWSINEDIEEAVVLTKEWLMYQIDLTLDYWYYEPIDTADCLIRYDDDIYESLDDYVDMLAM